MSHLTRHTSHVTRHTSHVTRHTSHVTRHTSHVTRHTSHVTRHTPHVTRHTSHATRHTPHVTRHTSHIKRAVRTKTCKHTDQDLPHRLCKRRQPEHIGVALPALDRLTRKTTCTSRATAHLAMGYSSAYASEGVEIKCPTKNCLQQLRTRSRDGELAAGRSRG